MEEGDTTNAVVTDQRNGSSSEPHALGGHSTVDINTGELLWEPEKVSQKDSIALTSSEG